MDTLSLIDSKPFMSTIQIEKFSEYLEKSSNYYEFGCGGSTCFAIRHNVKNIKSVESDEEWFEKVKQEISLENRERIINQYHEKLSELKKSENKISLKRNLYKNYTTYINDFLQESENKLCIKIEELKKIIKNIEKITNFHQIGNINIKYIDIGPSSNNWGVPSDESKKENWEKYPKSILEYDEFFDLILIDGRFRVASALCSLYRMNDDSILLFDDYVPRKYYHVLQYFFYPIETIDNNMKVFKKRNDINFENVEKMIEEYKCIYD
jgi:hypothetical protein